VDLGLAPVGTSLHRRVSSAEPATSVYAIISVRDPRLTPRAAGLHLRLDIEPLCVPMTASGGSFVASRRRV
jgi:hypothetical protein